MSASKILSETSQKLLSGLGWSGDSWEIGTRFASDHLSPSLAASDLISGLEQLISVTTVTEWTLKDGLQRKYP